MKKLITSLFLIITFTLCTFADAPDKTDKLVASWHWSGDKVDFEFYSYESGDSGYLRISNNTGDNLRVNFTYITNDGVEHHINNEFDAGKSENRSCADAGSKKTGIKSLSIKSVAVEK